MLRCPRCNQTKTGFTVNGRIPCTWYVDCNGDTKSCEEHDDGSWKTSDPARCLVSSCGYSGAISDFEKAADRAEAKVRCASCDWTGMAVDCLPIDDVLDRVEAGEEFPVGECPKCKALAHCDKRHAVPAFFIMDEAKKSADSLAKDSNHETDDIKVFELRCGRYETVYWPTAPGEEKKV